MLKLQQPIQEQKSYLSEFLDILKQNGINPASDLIARFASPNILPSVIEIVKTYAKRQDILPALDLYDLVKEAPKTGTKILLMKEENIFVNGPYFFYSHANLFRCLDGNTGIPLVLKTTNRREIRICNDILLNNPNKYIIKARPVNFVPDYNLSSRQELNAILMPMYTGSLSEFPAFPEQILYLKGEQILSALQYLHKLNWIHLDIRGANILVDYEGNWVVGDFNQSCQIGKKIKDETELLCLYFEPNERIGDITATPDIDFYMLGLTLLIESTCKTTFERELYDENGYLNWHKVNSLLNRVSIHNLRGFISHLLLYNIKYKKIVNSK